MRRILFLMTLLLISSEQSVLFAGTTQGKLKAVQKEQQEENGHECPNPTAHAQHRDQTVAALRSATQLLPPLAQIVAAYVPHMVWQQKEQVKRHERAIGQLKALNASRVLSTNDLDDDVSAWDFERKDGLRIHASRDFTSIAALSDEELVCAQRSLFRPLCIRNMVDSKKDREFPRNKIRSTPTAITPLSSGRCATGYCEGWVQVWDTEQCDLICEFPGPSRRSCRAEYPSVMFLLPMPNDTLLACYNNAKQDMRMFDVKTRIQKWEKCDRDLIWHVNKLANIDILFVAVRRWGNAGTHKTIINRRDPETGVLRNNELRLDYTVTSVQNVPNGTVALALCETGEIVIIDPQKFTIVRRLPGHTDRVSSLALLANKILVSASDDGSVILRDVATNRIVHRLRYRNTPEKTNAQADTKISAETKTSAEANKAKLTQVIALSDDRIATGDDQGAIVVWELGPCEA